MKKTVLLCVILFAVVLLSACPKIFGGKPKLKDAWGQVFAIKHFEQTPQGATVLVQDGVNYTVQDANAIDTGLQRSFDNASCLLAIDGKPYKQRAHTDYKVAILKATDTDSQGNPAYRVPCAQYCGTIYDKGGYILVAGQVIAIGQPYGNIIALPDSNTNFAYMVDGAAFETEHILLAWNNPNWFEQTKTHGDGNVHPILQECKQEKSVNNHVSLPYITIIEIDGKEIKLDSYISVVK